MTEKISERVKGVAMEEVGKIKDLTAEAARSGAYLYPIRVSRPDAVVSC